ncbi:TPA: Com family DNA-binding transcriptional regulator [Pasteurella multocida]
MQKTKELRCECCKKLLARASDVQTLEIKCVRCKAINLFNSINQTRVSVRQRAPERHNFEELNYGNKTIQASTTSVRRSETNVSQAF